MDKLISPKQIEVAVGIVANQKGELLIAKRPEHWLGAGFWEFPGGKIEPGEDPVTALNRELLEEVGIVVNSSSPLLQLSYIYPERKVIIYAFKVQTYSGEPAGLEGQEIGWCFPQNLHTINMLPANRAIVVATQLPEAYLITPDCQDANDFIDHLATLLEQGTIKFVQLRSKNLSDKDYAQLARKIVPVCHQYNCTLLLNSTRLELVTEFNADGVHLTSQALLELSTRPFAKSKWVGASCHNEEELLKAETIGVDFVTISPIVKSPEGSLGWEGFSNLVAKANIPVYALGGMTLNDLGRVKQLGGHGIAATRGLWGN